MKTVYVTIAKHIYRPNTLAALVRADTTGEMIIALTSDDGVDDLENRIYEYCKKNQYTPTVINIIDQTSPALDDSVPPMVRKEIYEYIERYESAVNIQLVSKSFIRIGTDLKRLSVMCCSKPSILAAVCLVDVYASLCSARHSLQMIYRDDYHKDNNMLRISTELNAALKVSLHNIKLFAQSCYNLGRERNSELLKLSTYSSYPDEYPVPADTLSENEVNLVYEIIGTMDILNNNFPKWATIVKTSDGIDKNIDKSGEN